MNRKEFLKILGGGALATTLTPNVLSAKTFDSKDTPEKITILHTNDQHSRIEPFEEGHSRYPNQGGFARRAIFSKGHPILICLVASWNLSSCL